MGDTGRNERAPSFSISTIDVESIEITKSDVVSLIVDDCAYKLKCVLLKFLYYIICNIKIGIITVFAVDVY